MNIYYRPHKSHKSEAVFFQTFRRQFPNANFPNENYRVEEDYLEKHVHTPSLLAALSKDEHLPPAKRENCHQCLLTCPTNIKINHNPAYISFDIVITADGKTYYWEFHENQHRRLTVNRTSKIYNAKTGAAIIVPRYVQRLVRDIWRVQHFRPYTIVWKDWFEINQNTFKPKLQPDFQEYVQPAQFSFREFYKLYEDSLNKIEK